MLPRDHENEHDALSLASASTTLSSSHRNARLKHPLPRPQLLVLKMN